MQDRALRSRIDKLWEAFWTGGITNPLTVIEQISFLMFSRLLDMAESRRERRSRRAGSAGRRYFGAGEQHLRWSQFRHETEPEALLRRVRDEVFPHFRELGGAGDDGGSRMAGFMKDAQLLIQKPSLMVQAVEMIDELPLGQGDTKGDLYEYLLSKLTTAGINGQFRTPRHVIRFMVELLEPKPTETVGDPACGTGGFLVGTLQYLLERYSSPAGVIEHEDGSKTYTGDRLEPYREHVQNDMLHGFDFDATMLRTAAMNLFLHGVEEPGIAYQDTLARSFTEGPNQPFAADRFDVVLANPPFKGSLDVGTLDLDLYGKLKTKKTELLFLALILRMLKTGGRAATIVPDGVLFGSSKAHVALRRSLIENHQLEGIFSLPSGVFKPYAGVSTAILVFTKGGATENVFFFDVEADGFSLDDKRQEVEDNDFPDALDCWRARDPARDTERTEKAFFVPAAEIRENRYDLSLNRYKEIVYEEEEYDPPRVILGRLRELEREILEGLDELEGMLE